MLRKLFIRNLALIKNIELSFEEGLTVFTGETGSGKSMLLGALQLISGEKADFSLLSNDEEKTIVEAFFEISSTKINSILNDNDLDIEDNLILRRELFKGKSRSFVNDTPVTLQVLKELSEQLIYIHSQHAILELKNSDFISNTLDVLSESLDIKSEFKTIYNQNSNLKKQIELLTNYIDESYKEREYIQFQIDELTELNLNKISYSELEKQLEQIENKDKIVETYQFLIHILNDERQVIDNLIDLKSKFEKNINIQSVFLSFVDRLNSVILELKELVNDSLKFIDNINEIDFDDVNIQGQLSKYNHTLLKHKVRTQDDLIDVLKKLSESNLEIEKSEENLKLFIEENKKLEDKLIQLDLQLQEKRRKAIPSIETKIINLLKELNLKDSNFKIKLEDFGSLTNYGSCKVNFYFSANKGTDIKLIEKVASGGEISRIMLIFQYLLSEKKSLQTLILDEIDTGISGEVAYKMAKMMKIMSDNLQMFVITHLPQVAASGKQHFKVLKETINNVSNTFVTSIDNESRIYEIAGLMSGEKINEAALKNAELLLKEI